MNKKDIANKADIQYLVETFYDKALKDDKLSPLFIAANFQLAEHIPVMISFWETILLDVVTYKGNPMLKHIMLHRAMPFKSEHFERWMEIWKETVRGSFSGDKAEEAISRAQGIARLMDYKISQLD